MTLRALTLCAACLVVGLAVGRFTAVPAEETHHETASEEIAVETSETTEAQEVAHHEAATTATERTEATAERVRVVWRERVVQADGATEERELEVDAETLRLAHEAEAYRQEVASLRAQLAASRSSEALAAATLDLRRELTPAQPDWRLSALIGLDLPSHAGDLPSYAAGLHIERRILGPIHVGAWGLSSGAVGGSVGVAW